MRLAITTGCGAFTTTSRSTRAGAGPRRDGQSHRPSPDRSGARAVLRALQSTTPHLRRGYRGHNPSAWDRSARSREDRERPRKPRFRERRQHLPESLTRFRKAMQQHHQRSVRRACAQGMKPCARQRVVPGCHHEVRAVPGTRKAPSAARARSHASAARPISVGASVATPCFKAFASVRAACSSSGPG